jgi:hypothetical protein
MIFSAELHVVVVNANAFQVTGNGWYRVLKSKCGADFLHFTTSRFINGHFSNKFPVVSCSKELFFCFSMNINTIAQSGRVAPQ